MSGDFYLTTTLPYVNADPHIGFALEIVAADVIARFKRSQDVQVVFNTGTDEHGQKIYQQAQLANQEPQAYTDFYAAKFADLKTLLDLSYTHFIRTTDPAHKAAAQEFWRRCAQRGDIYKHTYQALYCVGCELEKQNSELVDGRCPLHPTKELEQRDEENYFFKFSNYQQPLLDLYRAHPTFVQPESKMKEIIAFVEGGLHDFSISRLKSKMPWGIPVPNDDEHVMYVWFDALINYISTLGWPNDTAQFGRFWPGIQLAGKDNLRQQAAMWQAMLLSAQLPNSSHILINGFISVAGQKMSKSLGNVISPAQMVDRYGQAATRFLLMLIGPFGSDMDVTWERFDTLYTAHLANGLGNVCSRIAKLCQKQAVTFVPQNYELAWQLECTTSDGKKLNAEQAVTSELEQFRIKEAVAHITSYIAHLDQMLSTHQPWLKSGEEQQKILTQALSSVAVLTKILTPFLPSTCEQLRTQLLGEQVQSLSPLFPRINAPVPS